MNKLVLVLALSISLAVAFIGEAISLRQDGVRLIGSEAMDIQDTVAGMFR